MPEKKASKVWLVLLLIALPLVFLYLNRRKLIPHVVEVSYLKADLERDTAQVKAGVIIRNWLPFSIDIDSVKYRLRYKNISLGGGKHTREQTLPPVGREEIEFGLKLDLEKYREHLRQNAGRQDSLDINVAMQVYFNLPFLDPRLVTITRNVAVPVPRAPMMQLDSVNVAGFSPDEGYTLLLHITSANQNIPDLQVGHFAYNINFEDGTNIAGRLDSVFRIDGSKTQLQIPVKLSLSDAVDLVNKKLRMPKTWHYQANLSAVFKSKHPLIDQTEVKLNKEGSLNLAQLGSKAGGSPTLYKVSSLRIDSGKENTFLLADVLIDNPTALPIYIDSASYFVRHQGKMLATGKQDYELELRQESKTPLRLKLKADTEKLKTLIKQAGQKKELNLGLELNLVYDLPDGGRKKIALRKKVPVAVPKTSGGLHLHGISVQEINPQEGVQLVVQLKPDAGFAKNLNVTDFAYKLTLRNEIQISGNAATLTADSSGNIFNLPVRLSAADTYRLIADVANGVKNWPYKLAATANINAGTGKLSDTDISITKTGELDVEGGGGGKLSGLMPSLLRIDTVYFTLHYDTAWVRAKAIINNPLPVAVNVDSLHVELYNPFGLAAIVRSPEPVTITPKAETEVWLTASVNYTTWNSYLSQHQHLDSLKLDTKATVFYSLAGLFTDKLTLNRSITMGMPYSPMSEVEKVKLRGFGLRQGVKLNALLKIRNANVEQVQVSKTIYNVRLDNFADFCGTLNQTYTLPQGETTVKVPFNLSVWETLRALGRRYFGNPIWDTTLNADLTVNASLGPIQNTVLILERKSKTDSRKKANSQPPSEGQKTVPQQANAQ